VTSSATSERNLGVSRLVVNPHVLRCFLRPSLTEAPSLHRSYPASSVVRPLRHPIRPDLSLTSCQLIRTAITAGASRVASGLLCVHAIAITPAGLMEPIRSYSFHQRRPSPISRWVGSCINRFEACSAFPHGTACTLAESPSDPFHRKLRQLRCLRCRFDCYRVERTSSRAGLAPAEVQRLFTAHVIWRFITSRTQIPGGKHHPHSRRCRMRPLHKKATNGPPNATLHRRRKASRSPTPSLARTPHTIRTAL
jgi:hypothetical protein